MRVEKSQSGQRSGLSKRRAAGAGMAAWFAALMLAAFTGVDASAQTCTPYLASLPKGQALYLFFPTADSTVTVDGTNYNVGDFDAADLDATINTTQLRDRIFGIVKDSYCEFSVEVKKTTAIPAPTETRWQIIGIGSDTDGGIFGSSFTVDAGDNEPQDYAQVWADQFDVTYGYAGGAIDGANSTLERWATMIGGTVAHEGGHNYGLNHTDAPPRVGTIEDAVLNHIMATGNDFGATLFIRGDNRAKRNRHFSDTSFEILGHNIGLNQKTLHNWDFVNPNDTDATQLTIRVISKASTISITSAFNGASSPWTSPTVTKQPGTQNFQQDNTWNIYDIDFSTAKAWSGGANGTVPPGVKFHVGVGLSDTYIVWEVTLADGTGDLPLKPRMFGYDAGTAGTDSDGDFELAFFNTQAAAGQLILQDLEVLFLPRPVDIEQMVVGGELLATDQLPVVPFTRRPGGQSGEEFNERERPRVSSYVKRLTVDDEPAAVTVALLSDKRHVDITYDSTNCTPGIRTPDGFEPFDQDTDQLEVVYCPDGPALSLFPATYAYVKATVVDPNARYWDPVQAQFVDGPLESGLFYQFSGIVPDLNGNGADDLLDIRDGTSRDDNLNGVPDEVEGGRYALSVRLGATLPSPSALDSGISFNLGLEYYVRPNITIEGILGYHEFDLAGLSSNPEAIQLSINGRFYGSPAGSMRFFVNGGAGAYFLDPGSTEVGVNAGAGLDWDLAPDLALEAAYNYHNVDPGSTGFEFSTVQVGLRWQF